MPARLRVCFNAAPRVAGNRRCRISMCRGRGEGLRLRSVGRRERVAAGACSGGSWHTEPAGVVLSDG
jgi:hypothetical protein